VSEREGFAPGVPCWIDTWQPDAEAALRFYTALFGWQAEDTMPPDTPGRHFMCRLRGRDVAAIASRPESAPPVPAWNTYVWGIGDSGRETSVVDTDDNKSMRPSHQAQPNGTVQGMSTTPDRSDRWWTQP
jgi:predicted enzyme related to lactoylglutathione lyase